MKKIGFLLDTSDKIGSGHFWKCINLAKQLKKKIKKNKFFFISNTSKTFLLKILKQNNIEYIKINKLDNLNKIKKIVKKLEIKFLITDLYKLNSKKKLNIKKQVKKLIVIDDFDNKKHNSDIYINNNFLLNKSIRKIKNKNKNTLLLLGSKYLILNDKIINYKKKLNYKRKIKNILVFFGSYDPTNETLKFLSKAEKLNKIKFYVPVSKFNKNFYKNNKHFSKMKNVKLLTNYTNDKFLKIICKCDLSIGAGGVSLIENIVLGLPSLVVKIASNQENSINFLKNKKLIFYFGDKSKVNYELLVNHLDYLINNRNKFIEFAKKIFSYFKNKDLYLLSKKLSLIIKHSK